MNSSQISAADRKRNAEARRAKLAGTSQPPARRHGGGETAAIDKPGLRARQVAAKLLAAIVEQQASLDGLTDPQHGQPHFRQLPARDQGLVKAILVTALRFRGTLKAEISACLDRPLPANATTLAHHLHVGAAQIRFLDVPDSAAVDLAVTAAEADPRTRRFKGVVNAVLRRIARESGQNEVASDPATDCPPWLFERLSLGYGEARARAIAAAHRTPAPIDLTVKGEPGRWAERLNGTVIAGNTVRLGAATETPIAALEGFEEGAWWVQDASAALPVRLFGDLTGKSCADLCAAPGGKTAQLVLSGAASLAACEASRSRAKRLAGNLERLGLGAEILIGRFAETLGRRTFDAVLLDAPCSSTGTLRRHPDVGYTKSAEEVERLAGLQRQLLGEAAAHVAPGGVLVFSNCSLDPSEGEDVIARFLAERRDFERRPVEPNELEGFAGALTREGDVRTTPDMLADRGGVDGFFAARLVRRSGEPDNEGTADD